MGLGSSAAAEGEESGIFQILPFPNNSPLRISGGFHFGRKSIGGGPEYDWGGPHFGKKTIGGGPGGRLLLAFWYISVHL